MAQKDLMDWVWNNPRLRDKITRHNLQYLFEFDKQKGLSIDLRRFEPDYYRAVFYPPAAKKMVIDAFVHKVCRVLEESLRKADKAQLSLTVTVRHMVSEISHWRTFYIDRNESSRDPAPLIQKETDWQYPYTGSA
jgi:hypothetical protein